MLFNSACNINIIVINIIVSALFYALTAIMICAYTNAATNAIFLLNLHCVVTKLNLLHIHN